MLASLIPVLLCIALGWFIARIGWVRESSIKDLSNLVFLVLTPALLFRTMGSVRLQELDFRPAALYFAAVGVLFTLISLHSLVLLTAATLVFELADARDARARENAVVVPLWRTVLQAARKSIIHPVPLPILVGLLFAQTGLSLPSGIDKGLQMVGSALGPMALLLVGISLAYTHVGRNARTAVSIALAKNVVLPALVLLLSPLFGVSGLALAVMFVIAAMPVGANVFYFTQRYGVMQQEVSASIAASTLLALLTLPLAIWIAHWIQT